MQQVGDRIRVEATNDCTRRLLGILVIGVRVTTDDEHAPMQHL